MRLYKRRSSFMTDLHILHQQHAPTSTATVRVEAVDPELQHGQVEFLSAMTKMSVMSMSIAVTVLMVSAKNTCLAVPCCQTALAVKSSPRNLSPPQDEGQ